MKKSIVSVLLLSFFFVCCGDDKNPNKAPDDDEMSSSSSLTDSKSKKSSSSNKKGSSSSKQSSSSSKKTSSSSSYQAKIKASSIKKGTFTDKRDNQKYKYITIDNQTWMAQNLNYETEDAENSSCISNDCKKYGRSYTWKGLTEGELCSNDNLCKQPFQGACPDGWAVPTVADWDTLFTAVAQFRNDVTPLHGDPFIEYKGAFDVIHATNSDEYGFYYTTYWTSSNFNYGNRNYVGGWQQGYKMSIDENLARLYQTSRSGPNPVRCIKKELPKIDFSDPSKIKSNASGCEDSVWHPQIQPCNVNKVNSCKNPRVINGKEWVYTKKHVYEPYYDKMCPSGTHAPDFDEWNELFNMVGGKCFAGMMLKSAGYWTSGHNYDAYGFNIEPTGYYDVDSWTHTAYSNDYHFNNGNTIARFHVRKGTKENFATVEFTANSDATTYGGNGDITANLFCIENGIFPQDSADTYLNQDFPYGEFRDPRDGNVYKTTIIGAQKWMSQNLNYVTDSSFTHDGSVYSDYSALYGRYYTYEEALEVCPEGWHLPSEAAYDSLIYLTTAEYGLSSLESKQYSGGRDDYGFTLVFGGSRRVTDGNSEFYWTSTPSDDSTARCLDAYSSSNSIDIYRILKKQYLNVRCVSDTSYPYGYQGEFKTFTDSRDNETYKTVDINGKTWMAENLRFNAKRSFCKNDDKEFCAKYGRFYEQPFTTDTTEALCPEDWHIPTTAEFDSLLSFAKNDSDRNNLKETFVWLKKGQGDNRYGFSLLPTDCFYNSSKKSIFIEETPATCLAAEVHDEEGIHPYSYEISYTYFEKKELTKYHDRAYTIRCVKD
jgi:uncharacterized protein (TIGR02145 family)